MPSDTDHTLSELQEALKLVSKRGLATQGQLSDAAGVNQSTVSLAKRGMLTRTTHSTSTLLKTCQKLLEKPLPMPSRKIVQQINNFYRSGGTEAELEAVLVHSTKLIGRVLVDDD